MPAGPAFAWLAGRVGRRWVLVATSLAGALGRARSFGGAALALFTGFSSGWRYGVLAIGAICILAAILVAALFKDPGVGAPEEQLADLPERDRVKTWVIVGSVMSQSPSRCRSSP